MKAFSKKILETFVWTTIFVVIAIIYGTLAEENRNFSELMEKEHLKTLALFFGVFFLIIVALQIFGLIFEYFVQSVINPFGNIITKKYPKSLVHRIDKKSKKISELKKEIRKMKKIITMDDQGTTLNIHAICEDGGNRHFEIKQKFDELEKRFIITDVKEN